MICGMNPTLRIGAALCIASGQLGFAQNLTWSEVERMPRRWSFAACYDSWRERVIVTGGNPQMDPTARVWEWDGSQWAWRRPATSAGPSTVGYGAAFAFDELRGVAVLLTPGQISGRHDRWDWNGSDWRVARDQQGPNYIWGWLLNSEPMTGGMLAFGQGQSWRFDGAAWKQLTPDVTPKPGQNMAMALDVHRQRIVLVAADETWEWDGLEWHASGPVGVPLPTTPQLVFDDVRNQLLMLVKDAAPSTFRVHAWDGKRWSRVNLSGTLPEFDGSIQTTRAPGGGVLAFGGYVARWSGVWRLRGDRWQQLAGPANPELLGITGGLCSLTTDPRGSIWCHARGINGGDYELWEYRRGTWSLRAEDPSTWVIPRVAVWDEKRNRLVALQAGTMQPPPNNTCWEWDGTRWTKHPGPPVLIHRCVCCFDAALGYALFVFNTPTQGTQTFRWDGTTWTQFQTAVTPSDFLDIAHDRVRGQTIGISMGAVTWRWNGQTWIKLTPRTPPLAWTRGGLVFDGTSQRITAVSLDDQPRASAWDGTDWTVTPLPAKPLPLLADVAFAWDPSSGRICMHGLMGPQIGQGGTRTYLLTPEPAEALVVGSPCGGITPPHLGVFAKPALGERMALELQSTRALAPAAFLLGTASANIPLGPCTLRVDPLQPLVAVPALTDMHGFTRLPLPIPYDLTLRGFTVHTQALLDDPLVPLTRIATSAGLTLRIGD